MEGNQMSKLYWPVAIIIQHHDFGPDDFRKQWTYSACRTLEKAREQFDIWEKHGMKLVKKMVKVQTETNNTELAESHVHFGRVKDLWSSLADVSIDPDTECFTEPWGEFCVGTHREEIWHWFEDEFNVSVAEQLLGHEDEVWDGQNRFLIVKDPCYPAYRIWNIGSNMVDGYLPLCKLKQVQPFEGGMEIEPDTLRAIRTDGAQTILRAIGFGPETSEEMEAYIRDVANGVTKERYGYAAARMHMAIPWMKQIGL